MRSLFIILLFSCDLKAQVIERPSFYYQPYGDRPIARKPMGIYNLGLKAMPTGEGYIFISFILTKETTIEKIEFTENTPQHFVDSFRREILKYESYWTPQKIDGQPMNSKIVFIVWVCGYYQKSELWPTKKINFLQNKSGF